VGRSDALGELNCLHKLKAQINAMKFMEIIDRIDEMAFKRRAIIDKLRALQTPIHSDALKMAYTESHSRVRKIVFWD
jgi:hypothetical protein